MKEARYRATTTIFKGTVSGNIDNYSNASVINTADGSYTTIRNHSGYTIGTINTGNNSTTTINNRGIIDSIKTEKDSSLVLNNSGKVTKVDIGENSNSLIYNSGSIGGEQKSFNFNHNHPRASKSYLRHIKNDT